MNVWLSFAFISHGVVQNITCYLYTGYSEANDMAKFSCQDPDAFAVDVTQYPVWIGDRYEDGYFKRIDEKTGEEIIITPFPTEQDQIVNNTNDIDSIQNAIDDITVAILEG